MLYQDSPLKNAEILTENKHFLVVNKPAGLAAHNGAINLVDLLEKQAGERLHLVHRLDRETSGLILLARGSQSTQLLQETLSKKESKKEYLAIMRGQVEPKIEQWSFPISSKAEGRQNPAGRKKDQVSAVTDYRVVDQNKWLSLVHCVLLTGRQHQIRKHAALAGHHIIGDPRYGDKAYQKMIVKRYGCQRMLLHAHRLSFTFNDTKYDFVSPMPDSWLCFGLSSPSSNRSL